MLRIETTTVPVSEAEFENILGELAEIVFEYLGQLHDTRPLAPQSLNRTGTDD